jgi:hypothetical protein
MNKQWTAGNKGWPQTNATQIVTIAVEHEGLTFSSAVMAAVAKGEEVRIHESWTSCPSYIVFFKTLSTTPGI